MGSENIIDDRLCSIPIRQKWGKLKQNNKNNNSIYDIYIYFFYVNIK